MSYQNVFDRFKTADEQSPEFAELARQVWQALNDGKLPKAPRKPRGTGKYKCRYPFPVATVEWEDGTCFDVAFYSAVNKPLDWEHAIRVADDHYRCRRWSEHRPSLLVPYRNGRPGGYYPWRGYDEGAAIERAFKAGLNVPPIVYMLEHQSGEEWKPN